MATDMILRRLADAIRRQDWVTVSIEFVIVVLGIFVGLQVDGWNQARNEQSLEKEYLDRLLADTQWNIDNFRELESVYESKSAFIISLLGAPAIDLYRAAPKEFFREFGYSNYIALPAVKAATFSELESSGRLSLLRDVALRDELASFYSNYQLIQDILDEPIGDYRRLIHETIPGDLYYRLALAENSVDPEGIGEALSNLQANARFEASANAEIAYATQLIIWLRRHRLQAENIVTMIGRSEHQE